MEDKMLKIAIVEDNEFYSSLLSFQLRAKLSAEISMYACGEDLLATDVEQYDVVLLDLKLDSVNDKALDGQEILKILTERKCTAKFVILSAEERIETAIEVLNIGAVDYIVKNEQALEKLLASLHDIIEYKNINHDLDAHAAQSYTFRRSFIFKSLILTVVIAISCWLLMNK